MAGTDLKHRLAAILAADAVGYSSLMAADELATVSSLDAARIVFRAAIEANQGRVIDMAGDSVLAVFDAASGAVTAALAAQRGLAAAQSSLPERRRMRFRVGVHLGDVIEKADGTVYGDGVNIAARLQSLAEPGGVSVSDAVRGAADLRRAHELNPNEAFTLFYLSMTEASDGNVERAKELAAQALRMSPKDRFVGVAHLAYAMSAFIERDFDALRKWAELAIQSHSSAPIRRVLMIIYAAQAGDERLKQLHAAGLRPA